MSQAAPSNVAASVKQRLLNRAREQKEDFNLLLTKYGLERILYRIGREFRYLRRIAALLPMALSRVSKENGSLPLSLPDTEVENFS